MQLSEKVINYINFVNIPKAINSNCLITDLEKIIYTSTFTEDEYYMSNSLSIDLLLLIKEWDKAPISEELFLMENNSSNKIICDDKKNYAALMIFPIYLKDKIERSYNIF